MIPISKLIKLLHRPIANRCELLNSSITLCFHELVWQRIPNRHQFLPISVGFSNSPHDAGRCSAGRQSVSATVLSAQSPGQDSPPPSHDAAAAVGVEEILPPIRREELLLERVHRRPAEPRFTSEQPRNNSEQPQNNSEQPRNDPNKYRAAPTNSER